MRRTVGWLKKKLKETSGRRAASNFTLEEID
jgi:hypothetical protein